MGKNGKPSGAGREDPADLSLGDAEIQESLGPGSDPGFPDESLDDAPVEDTRAQRMWKVAVALFLLFLLVGWYFLLLLR